MANLNKVFLIGNLTRAPELRYTPASVAVANLGLAVNRRFRDKNGEFKEDVCFLTVTVWDKQAEACCQNLQKGSPVFVEGVLQSRSWETNDGQKRSTIDVRAERIQFLGKFAGDGKQLEKMESESSSSGESNGEGAALGDAVNPMDVAWDE
jgi:single-strand DNA-binding protein